MQKETLYVRNLVAYKNKCVLSNVSFMTFEGEVLGLVGPHGSGISNLLAILQGQDKSDSGTIFMEGKRIKLASAADANQAGIYRIDRTSLIIENLDVAENIVLTNPPIMSQTFVRNADIRCKAREILDTYGIKIDVREKAYNLNEYERNAISIVKVTMHNAKVLIMNNVNYSPQQRSEMRKLIARIQEMGVSVIICSTEAESLIDFTDRLIVFNEGRIEGSFLKKDYNLDIINRLMKMQHAVTQPVRLMPREEMGLEIKNLVVGEQGYGDICIRRGEVVGFLDLHGRNDKTLIYVLAGKIPYSGSIRLAGRSIEIRSKRDAMNCGIAYLPAYDAPGTLHGNLTIEDNFLLLNPKAYVKRGLINRRLQRFACRQFLKNSSVPLAVLRFYPDVLDAHQRNEINLVMMRALKPKVVILDDSFVNTDAAMKTQILHFVQEMIENGACVIASILAEADQKSLNMRQLVLAAQVLDG